MVSLRWALMLATALRVSPQASSSAHLTLVSTNPSRGMVTNDSSAIFQWRYSIMPTIPTKDISWLTRFTIPDAARLPMWFTSLVILDTISPAGLRSKNTNGRDWMWVNKFCRRSYSTCWPNMFMVLTWARDAAHWMNLRTSSTANVTTSILTLPGVIPSSMAFLNRSEEHTSELQSRENLVC